MKFQNDLLKDKVAIVTGASRGIGAAIATGFAAVGASVVLASRKADALETVAAGIRDAGGRATAVAAHTGKREDVEALVARTVELYGRVDVLVNNAATNPTFGPLLHITEEAWDKIMQVNLKGCYLMSLEAGRVMMENGGGSIIMIASTGGIRPMPGLGAYCVSKAGLVMMAKVLASEWATFNIRVNTIAPGLIRTRFSKTLWETPEILEIAMRDTPMNRVGEPEEIVDAALFLASDGSGYMTGSTVVIDGGSSI